MKMTAGEIVIRFLDLEKKHTGNAHRNTVHYLTIFRSNMDSNGSIK